MDVAQVNQLKTLGEEATPKGRMDYIANYLFVLRRTLQWSI